MDNIIADKGERSDLMFLREVNFQLNLMSGIEL